jgi:hypothetical protein
MNTLLKRSVLNIQFTSEGKESVIHPIATFQNKKLTKMAPARTVRKVGKLGTKLNVGNQVAAF